MGTPNIASGRISRWYTAGLFTLYGLILLTHRTAASLTDYSDWTYEGILLRDRILGLPDPFHILKLYPVPNSLTTVGVAGFALLFSWKIAAKLWLCTLLFFSYQSSKYMMRRFGDDPVLWLAIPAALFLNVNFWYGFINFQFGLCWVLFVMHFLLNEERRDWIFGVLLVLCFFSHTIPFVFAYLLVFFYALQSRRLKLIWQLIPSTLLSLWYVLGRFYIEGNADGHAGMVPTVKTYSAAFWAYKVNSYFKSFGFINPSNSQGSIGLHMFGVPLFLSMQVLNFCLCTLIAYGLCVAAISGYRHGAKERFIWIAATIFFIIFVIAPATTLGISDPGSRLLQTTMVVLAFFAAAPGTLPPLSRRIVVACSIPLQIAAVVLFASTVFTSNVKGSMTSSLPVKIILFASAPIHFQDGFLEALDNGDKSLRVFPTALFTSTPASQDPLLYSPAHPTNHSSPQ